MRKLCLCSVLIGIPTFGGTQALAQPMGDPAAGRAFALEVCTPCHVVAPDQVSPRRLAVAADFHTIANTSGMTEMALHAFLSTPHPTMPNLILSPEEDRDVVAYIHSLMDR